MKIREIAVSAFLTAILYLQQVALSPLPNIHLCALLLILYTLYFPKLVFPVTAAYFQEKSVQMVLGGNRRRFRTYLRSPLRYSVFIYRRYSGGCCLLGFGYSF